MMIRDSLERYGIVSHVLHWTMAAGMFGTFALGLWMVRLDYYSPYYTSAPALHRSIGLLLLCALLMRMIWRTTNAKPRRPGLTPFESMASRIVHAAFYPLLLVLMLSGYLISTADGRAINVFGWISVPSLIHADGLSTVAGNVHRWIAYAVMLLAAGHAGAALKHTLDHRAAKRRLAKPALLTAD